VSSPLYAGISVYARSGHLGPVAGSHWAAFKIGEESVTMNAVNTIVMISFRIRSPLLFKIRIIINNPSIFLFFVETTGVSTYMIYCLSKMLGQYFNDGFYAYFAQAENDL